jgi:hypothetical protein
MKNFKEFYFAKRRMSSLGFIPVLYTHHPITLPKTPNKPDLSSS